MKNKKILYITNEGFDTPGPNNHMALLLIDNFLQAGYEVHLIQSVRSKKNPEIPDILNGRPGFTFSNIRRKIVPKTKFVKRYMNDLLYIHSSFWRWIKVRKVGLVFFQSTPTAFFHILLLRIFKRAKILYNIYDIFPGHAKDIGVIKSPFVFSVLRHLQRVAYRLSHNIVVLSDDMKTTLIEEKVRKEKISVIKPWFEMGQTKEVLPSKNAFFEKYHLNNDRFIVQYAGTIGQVFDYKIMLEVAEKLKDFSDIIFHIIGDGASRVVFQKEAEARNLANIKFFPLQPLEMISDVYSSCSICFIPLKKGVIRAGVPSKIANVMACRRLVVVSVEKDSIFFGSLKDENIGVPIPNEDASGKTAADTILFLYSNPVIMESIANNGFKYATENYTDNKNIPLFLGILNEMSKRK